MRKSNFRNFFRRICELQRSSQFLIAWCLVSALITLFSPEFGFIALISVGVFVSYVTRSTDANASSIEDSHERDTFVQSVLDLFDLPILIFNNSGALVGHNHALTEYFQVHVHPSDAEPFSFLGVDSRNELTELVERVHYDGSGVRERLEVTFECDGHNETATATIRQIMGKSGEQSYLLVVFSPSASEYDGDEGLISRRSDALSVFAAGFAHNLNNLLGSMIGAISILERRYQKLDDQTRHSLLKSIKRTALRGANLAKELQSYGKTTQSSRERQVVSLVPIIQDAINDAKQFDERDCCQVQVVSAEDEVFAACDEGGIHQVVLNLLVNAIDAIEGEGTISISIRPLGGFSPQGLRFVELEVSDTGKGMGPEILARIFEPFYTTKGTATSEKKQIGGSGLGLSTVQNMIEAWGGRISCESEVGKGTTFLISLLPARVLEKSDSRAHSEMVLRD